MLDRLLRLASNLFNLLRLLSRDLENGQGIEIDRYGNIRIQGYNYVIIASETGIQIATEQIIRLNGRLLYLNSEPTYRPLEQENAESRSTSESKT